MFSSCFARKAYRNGFAVFCVILLVFMAVPTAVRAQTLNIDPPPTPGTMTEEKTWVGSDGASWSANTNWSPSGEPQLGEQATIDSDTTCVISSDAIVGQVMIDGVTSSDNPALRIASGGSLSLSTTPAAVFIGYENDGAFQIDQGGSAAASAIVLGSQANSFGTMTLNGGITLNSFIYVGDEGEGELNVGTSTTSSMVPVILGYSATGRGTLNITGAPTTGTFPLIVGYGGTGMANLTDYDQGGATLSIYAGEEAGGSGTVMVENSDLICGEARIGNAGTGAMYLMRGSTLGVINGSTIILGTQSGGSGSLNIMGSGSRATGMYMVGKAGEGTINVVDGGQLGNSGSMDMAVLGYEAGSQGTLVLDGGAIAKLAQLAAGYAGNGTIEVKASSTLDTPQLSLGANGGSGTLIIDNSSWTTGSGTTAWIGQAGHGEMTVRNASNVEIEWMSLANDDGSSAALTVTDEGTILDVGTLVLGTGLSSSTSQATAVVSHHATVMTDALYFGFCEAAAPNRLEVSNGGSLTVTGDFLTGMDATAQREFSVLSGGTAVIDTLRLDTTIVQLRYMDILASGENSLLKFITATQASGITPGAMLSNGANLTVESGAAFEATSLTATEDSTVVITGSGTTFDSDEYILALCEADNAFTINGGAHATTKHAVFSNYGEVSSYDISGEGTRLDVTEDLQVGPDGDGTVLDILDGAVVTAGSVSVGTTTSTITPTSTVNVSGEGSRLDVAGELDLAPMDSLPMPGGVLNVSAGGTVSAGTINLRQAMVGGDLPALNLSDGGEVIVGTLQDTLSARALNWTGGTLHFTGSTSLSNNSSWVDDLTVGEGRTLTIDNTLNIRTGGSLTIAGGTVDVTSLNNELDSPIDLQYGTVYVHGGTFRWATPPALNPYTSLNLASTTGQQSTLTLENVSMPATPTFLTSDIGQVGSAALNLTGGTQLTVVGSLTIGIGAGEGTVTVSGSGSSLTAGKATVGNDAQSGTGVLTIENSAAANINTLVVNDGGTVTVDGGVLNAGALSGAGQLDLTDPTVGQALVIADGGDKTFSGGISGTGGVRKTGSSTQTLSGALSYTGQTVINGGTLVIPVELAGSGGGIVVNSGGTLVTGNGTLQGRAVSGTGTINVGGNTIMGRGGVNGGFDFDGTLNVGSHTLTLNDNNRAALGRTVNIDGGTIQAANGVRLGSVDSQSDAYVLNATGQSYIDSEFRNNGMVHGPAADGQWLVLSGAVSGAGNYDGNVAFTHSYSPGNSPAIVDMEDVMFTAGNTLTMEIGGTVAGSDYDQLNVSGLAMLGGTLELVFLDGYALQPGETYTLIAGAIDGEFDSIIGLPDGWDATYDPATGMTLTPEPGTLALLGLGGLAMLSRVRRRRAE